MHLEELQTRCPFTPALTNQSREITERNNLKPIHERYQKEIEKKEKKIKKQRELKKRIEDIKERKSIKNFTSRNNKRRSSEIKFGFKPKYESAGLARSKDLYKQGKKMIEKRNERIYEEQTKRFEMEFEEDEDFYKPKINEYSKSVVKSNFEERQKMFKRRKNRNKRQLSVKNSCSFKPKLNEKSIKMLKPKKKNRRKSYTARNRRNSKLSNNDGFYTRRMVDSKDYLKDSGFSLDPYNQEENDENQNEENTKRRGGKYTPTPIFNKNKSIPPPRSTVLSSRRSFGSKRPTKKVLEKMFDQIDDKSKGKGSITERGKVWNRLYNAPGKSARGSLIVAARPEKEGQAALTLRQHRPPICKRKSMKDFDKENRDQNIVKKRSRVNLSFGGKVKSRNLYESLGKMDRSRSKKKKKIANLEFEKFEEFCQAFQSGDDFYVEF